MKQFQIYLAGGMQGLTFDEMNTWRTNIKNKILQFDSIYHTIFINPVDYYNFERKKTKKR